jgi:hypothetical protein
MPASQIRNDNKTSRTTGELNRSEFAAELSKQTMMETAATNELYRRERGTVSKLGNPIVWHWKKLCAVFGELDFFRDM